MIRWRRWMTLRNYKPNEEILDWAQLKPRNQFERYNFQSVLWKIVHHEIVDDDNEDTIEEMWLDVYFDRWVRLTPEMMDFSFIDEDFLDEHLFWSLFIESQHLLKAKSMKKDVLKLTQKQKHDRLPKRHKPYMLSPHPQKKFIFLHSAPYIEIEAMERFAFKGVKKYDYGILKRFKDIIECREIPYCTKMLISNWLFMNYHWMRFDKWERDVDQARWDNRARIERRKLFNRSWTKRYQDLPEWMHRDPKISKRLKFIWYNFWVKKLRQDKEFNRQVPWLMAYEWNPMYKQPRDNIIPQEPFVPRYAYEWKQKRITLQKKIAMTEKLEDERIKQLKNHDLKYNKMHDRYLDRPRLKTPVEQPVPRYKSKVYEIDEEGRYWEKPPEHKYILYKAEDDLEQDTYDVFYAATKDGPPRIRIPPEPTRQAICDEWFKNVPSPTLNEIWNPDKNHDHRIVHMKFRTDCYDPHVPKPKHPHKYLRKGENAEKEKIRREKLFWERIFEEYEELLLQREDPIHPEAPPPPPPPPPEFRYPARYRPFLKYPHQDRMMALHYGRVDLKTRRKYGPPREQKFTKKFDFQEDWERVLKDNKDKYSRAIDRQRAYDAMLFKWKMFRIQKEFDKAHYPYYAKIADQKSIGNVIKMKSIGCSIAAAKMVDGPRFLLEAKYRPCPLRDNEFMRNLDSDDMQPLSEKARELVGWMNRQTKAANDILKNINLPDAGMAYNAERKLKRLANAAESPQILLENPTMAESSILEVASNIDS